MLTAKTRMQADIGYLNTRLSKLDGFGDTGEYLLKIVNSKKIETPPPALPEKDTVDATAEDDAAKETDKPSDTAGADGSENRDGDAK
jgi:vacuolar protein sorting-associated protein 54